MQRESLVMIPGTLCDERIFAQQAKYLLRHCNVILVNYKDLRCLKDWPKHLLSKLPLNFSVLGFSLGGIWALELLRQEPRRINRIALIASNAKEANKLSALRSQKMWANWKVNGPKLVIDEASKKYFYHDLHLMKHLPLLEDMALKTKSHVAKMTFEWAAKRPSGHAVISQYENPILLVSGEKTRCAPKRLKRKLCKTTRFQNGLNYPDAGTSFR